LKSLESASPDVRNVLLKILAEHEKVGKLVKDIFIIPGEGSDPAVVTLILVNPQNPSDGSISIRIVSSSDLKYLLSYDVVLNGVHRIQSHQEILNKPSELTAALGSMISDDPNVSVLIGRWAIGKTSATTPEVALEKVFARSGLLRTKGLFSEIDYRDEHNRIAAEFKDIESDISLIDATEILTRVKEKGWLLDFNALPGSTLELTLRTFVITPKGRAAIENITKPSADSGLGAGIEISPTILVMLRELASKPQYDIKFTGNPSDDNRKLAVLEAIRRDDTIPEATALKALREIGVKPGMEGALRTQLIGMRAMAMAKPALQPGFYINGIPVKLNFSDMKGAIDVAMLKERLGLPDDITMITVTTDGKPQVFHTMNNVQMVDLAKSALDIRFSCPMGIAQTLPARINPVPYQSGSAEGVIQVHVTRPQLDLLDAHKPLGIGNEPIDFNIEFSYAGHGLMATIKRPASETHQRVAELVAATIKDKTIFDKQYPSNEELQDALSGINLENDVTKKSTTAPGKNPSDAIKVIATIPELQKEAGFTVPEYIKHYNGNAARLGFEGNISESTARRDLYSGKLGSLEEWGIIERSALKNGFKLTSVGRALMEFLLDERVRELSPSVKFTSAGGKANFPPKTVTVIIKHPEHTEGPGITFEIQTFKGKPVLYLAEVSGMRFGYRPVNTGYVHEDKLVEATKELIRVGAYDIMKTLGAWTQYMRQHPAAVDQGSVEIDPNIEAMLRKLAGKEPYNLLNGDAADAGKLRILEAIRRNPQMEIATALSMLTQMGLEPDMAQALYVQLIGLRVLAMDSSTQTLPAGESALDNAVQQTIRDNEAWIASLHAPTVRQGTLEEEITKYVEEKVRAYGAETVPGLEFEDWKRIYTAIQTMRSDKIEMLLPQNAQGMTFTLTEATRKTLEEIKRKVEARGGSFTWGQYTDSNIGKHLERNDGVKRIIITDDRSASTVGSILKASPEKFENVRIYNMALPADYFGMDPTSQSVCQARAITLAILMRIYEAGDQVTETLLTEMLEGRLDEMRVGDFIANLPEKEIEKTTPAKRVARLEGFLRCHVSLAELLGKQLRLLEKFVWCAA
jgi:hypothetical protein